MTTTTTTTTTTKLASDNSDALVTAQTAAVAKVTNTYNATVAKGVTLPNPVGKGTITLPADRTSKHELSSLAAHLINSQAPATSGVSIDDINGNLITMTVAQFQTLMVAYGTACLTAWTAYRQQVSQINAATDIPTITLIAS
jgi:hypothetical protein